MYLHTYRPRTFERLTNNFVCRVFIHLGSLKGGTKNLTETKTLKAQSKNWEQTFLALLAENFVQWANFKRGTKIYFFKKYMDQFVNLVSFICIYYRLNVRPSSYILSTIKGRLNSFSDCSNLACFYYYGRYSDYKKNIFIPAMTVESFFLVKVNWRYIIGFIQAVNHL